MAGAGVGTKQHDCSMYVAWVGAQGTQPYTSSGLNSVGVLRASLFRRATALGASLLRSYH